MFSFFLHELDLIWTENKTILKKVKRAQSNKRSRKQSMKWFLCLEKFMFLKMMVWDNLLSISSIKQSRISLHVCPKSKWQQICSSQKFWKLARDFQMKKSQHGKWSNGFFQKWLKTTIWQTNKSCWRSSWIIYQNRNWEERKFD